MHAGDFTWGIGYFYLMPCNKKWFVVSGIVILLGFGVAASRPPAYEEEGPKPKNLKVLSKKLTHDDLERIMGSFDKQLGVTCIYCHSYDKYAQPRNVDFASDENPKKLIAREMIRMSIRLNKKYFGKKVDDLLFHTSPIWCTTCHRGFPVPITKIPPVVMPR